MGDVTIRPGTAERIQVDITPQIFQWIILPQKDQDIYAKRMKSVVTEGGIVRRCMSDKSNNVCVKRGVKYFWR